MEFTLQYRYNYFKHRFAGNCYAPWDFLINYQSYLYISKLIFKLPLWHIIYKGFKSFIYFSDICWILCTPSGSLKILSFSTTRNRACWTSMVNHMKIPRLTHNKHKCIIWNNSIFQTVYVEEHLKNVPQLHCEFSGITGFANHLLPPNEQILLAWLGHHFILL